MEESVKESVGERRHTIRWREEDWARIERAAEKLASEMHVEIDPVDLIRGASLRRADEILGAA